MLAIKAFRLKQGRQTYHHNYLIGGFGTCHRLGDEIRIGSAVSGLNLCVNHLTVFTQGGGKHVQWLVDLRGIDLRTAGSLKPRGFGKSTDYRQLAGFFEGQCGSCFSTKPHLRVPRVGPVRGEHLKSTSGVVPVMRACQNKRGHIARCGVEVGLLQKCRAHGSSSCAIVDAPTAGHFQIEPCGDPLRAVINGAPIGNDQALKAPTVTQNILGKILFSLQ